MLPIVLAQIALTRELFKAAPQFGEYKIWGWKAGLCLCSLVFGDGTFGLVLAEPLNSWGTLASHKAPLALMASAAKWSWSLRALPATRLK